MARIPPRSVPTTASQQKPTGSQEAPSAGAQVAPEQKAQPNPPASPPPETAASEKAAAPALQQAAPAVTAAPAAKPTARALIPMMQAPADEEDVPWRLFLVGEPGIGKSTFGMRADSPVFIPAERSPNVPRTLCLKPPETWEDIFALLRALYANQHSYKTLVLDTADQATSLCTAHVIEKAPKGSGTRGNVNYLSDVGQGFRDAGSAALEEEWMRLLSALDRLVEARRMNIIVLGHTKLGKYRNPEAGGLDFDMWIPAVDEKVAARLRGWSDTAALAKKDIRTARDGNGKKGRGKAVAIGEAHMLYARAIPSAPWVKNRYNLPEKMPLDYEVFAGYMEHGRTKLEHETILTLIRDKAKRLAGHTFMARNGEMEYSAWVDQRLKHDLNMGDLMQIDSRLQAKINELFPDEGDDENGEKGSA